MSRFPSLRSRAPVHVANLAHSFRTETPTGALHFVAVLTTDNQEPLAHGKVHLSPWEFIDGAACFTLSFSHRAIGRGRPTQLWTFAVDDDGNAALFDHSPVDDPESVRPGDLVSFIHSHLTPLRPLPNWLLEA